MNDLRHYLLALTFTSYTLKEQHEILLHTSTIQSLKKWLTEQSLTRADEVIHQGVSFITITDSVYPDHLKEIYLPPIVLYYEGNISLLKQPGIGMVGSRQMTKYGQSVIQKLISEARNDQLNRPIISGLARGVDGYCHYQSLLHQLDTIAVVGTGLHTTYPKKHERLDHAIRKNGLVVSEYPPKTPPRKKHFPMRNRIIAGLCSDLIVVEAKERSGSLITANLALQENRNVFAVPGSILSEQSVGTNQIIQAGATPLTKWQDVNLL